MWLPMFLLWSYPVLFLSKPALSQSVPFLRRTGSTPLLVSAIAASLAAGTVLLACCYYYLARRLQSRSRVFHDRRSQSRDVLILSLLVCLLWQNSYGNGWPYRWIFRSFLNGVSIPMGNLALYVTLTSLLAMFLLMIVVFVINRVFEWSLDGQAQDHQDVLAAEIQNTNLRSLIGASLLAVSALLFWQVLSQPLTKVMLLPPLGEVFQRMTFLVMSEHSTLWRDMSISLQVIFGGILWAGLFAVPLVEFSYYSPGLRRWGGLLALSCISPIVLQDAAILWLGVGVLRIAFSVSCFAFFPLVQGLWSYRHLPLPTRLLVSIDEALPYAFIGMLSNEIYASKEGLGYTIAVASHTFQTAKAFAAILILFALSATVRWITKRVVLPSAKAATPANLEQNPAVG